MKTFKNILSWTSFVVIVMVMGCFCMYCGVCVANFLKDFFHVTGWWCLILSIPLLIVALSVEMFFILGLKKFGGEEK